jgi:hypothetical protein
MAAPDDKNIERPRMGPVIARATTSPVNLGVAAGSAVLAVGLASWPLAVLGGLAYGAMVAFDSINPAFWKKVYPSGGAARLPAPKLPAAAAIQDPGTRAAVTQILAARAELDRVIKDTPADVMSQLSTTLSFLRELESNAARLVVRAEDLAKHLASVDVAALQADCARLAQRAAASKDPSAKAGFEEARAAREDELRTIDELSNAKDRIDANLQRLVAVLSGLPTKVVHMRALDAQAMDQLSGDMNAELAAVAGELKTSEEVMKSLGEIAQ